MKKKPEDYLSEHAVKQAEGIKISFFEEQEKYSKRQFAQIYKGYDFLENMLAVRTYIQKRYDIDWHTLELFIKLMGLKIFTRKDYGDVPKNFKFTKFRHMIELGHLVVLSDHRNVENRLYTLSIPAKNIVMKFYQYLSGEEKIPELYSKNPMNNKAKQIPFDKKKMDLIKLMNTLPMKEHNKKLLK